VLARRDAWTVTLVAMLTMTVSYVDRSTFNVLAPTITKALDLTETQFGILGSAFSIAYLFATPLSGWWIDRIGARRGLLGSVLAWSSIAALHAIVPGFWTLFVLRIALGVAEGPSFPGSAQTMQRVLSPIDRSRGFALLFTGSSIGSMIAPPLASALYDQWGWRVALLGTTAIGLSWIPLWLLATSRRHVAAQLDTPAPTESGLAPLSYRDLATHPWVVRAIIGVFAVALATNIWGGWGAKYLMATFDLKQEQVGHYLWLPPLCLDAGAIVFGDLFARTRRPRVLFAIAAVMASAIALEPWCADTPWHAIAIACVSIAGGGAAYTVITADLMSRIPAEAVSAAGGLIAAGQSFALIIANPVIGRIVDHEKSYDLVTWGVGAWVVPGALVWLLWGAVRKVGRDR
jgi:ACS family hexuronate transporter-like MFS transporter